MKKFVAMLIAVSMVLSLTVTAFAATPPENDGTPWGTITYMSGTEPNQDIMSGWSNIATTAVMRELVLGGADILYMEPGGNFLVNQRVVRNQERIANADGTVTYINHIWDDWVFNDGTPLTAYNYVFSALLAASPMWRELDASPGGIRLEGYGPYNAGETNVFAGVGLIDEYTFSITIAAEWLPYYWEFTFADVRPYPMHVIAPGVTIADDGNGAYFVGDISTDLLRDTILDPVTGYRFNPRVTIGPYQIREFDLPDYMILERNMLFKGTWDYAPLLIQEIIVRYFDDSIINAAFEAGEGDLMTGVTQYDDIMEFLALADAGILHGYSYDRPGFGYLGFQADHGPTQFQAVRQANAWLIDRDEFNRIFLGGMAVTINSEYTGAQYIYQENREWLEDNLDHWTYNPAIANQLLDDDGWIYNADGSERVPGSDTLRHKMVDGELMPLIIEWAASTSQGFSNTLNDLWVPAAASVGMQVNRHNPTFAELSRHWGRTDMVDDEIFYHAYNLAANLTSIINAVWNNYSILPEFQGNGWNNHFLIDEELYESAMNMYYATTQEEYDAAWLHSLFLLNQLVPKVWIYANTWWDFIRFDSGLENFHGSGYWSFHHAIQRAWIAR